MFVVDTLTQELYEENITKIKIERKEPVRAELENFVAAVEKGQGQIVMGEKGLRNLDLALAFLTSAVEARVINPSFSSV